MHTFEINTKANNFLTTTAGYLTRPRFACTEISFRILHAFARSRNAGCDNRGSSLHDDSETQRIPDSRHRLRAKPLSGDGPDEL